MLRRKSPKRATISPASICVLAPDILWREAPRHGVRDRDRVYGSCFIRHIRAMGIRDRPIRPRSPWQNGYAERLIGSIRRECLDHVVVFGERHLSNLLRSYQTYYNACRTRVSLDKEAPLSRPVTVHGRYGKSNLGPPERTDSRSGVSASAQRR